MGPALRAGELSSPSVSASASTGGLRRTGRAKGAGLSSNLGAAAGFSRTSILGNQRGMRRAVGVARLAIYSVDERASR